MTAETRPQFQPSAPASPGTIDRGTFDRLSSADRARAMRENWRVVDTAKTPTPTTLLRSAFDRLRPEMRRAAIADFVARGGVIADEAPAAPG
jgi:hypothetical protein